MYHIPVKCSLIIINSQVRTTFAKQLLFVIVASTGISVFISNPAFANSSGEHQVSIKSNEKAKQDEEDNGWHGGMYFGPNRSENTNVAPPAQGITNNTSAPVNSAIVAKKVEPVNPNYFYGAVDFGSNVIYATNGSRVATSSSGLQVTGKFGYSMNGPRVELESSVGSLDSGSASFTGTGVNAYYAIQTVWKSADTCFHLSPTASPNRQPVPNIKSTKSA